MTVDLDAQRIAMGGYAADFDIDPATRRALMLGPRPDRRDADARRPHPRVREGLSRPQTMAYGCCQR